MNTPAIHVFVYGTLKQGMRNHHVNRGRRLPGQFVTAQPHPLFIVGPRLLPWLLPRPGSGHPVRGEVYEVSEEELAAMDALEGVGRPGWYERRLTEVRPDDARARADGLVRASPVQAWVYFGSELGFSRARVQAGPMPEYTAEHAARFDPDLRRDFQPDLQSDPDPDAQGQA